MDFNCRMHPNQAYLFYCIDHDAPCCAECKRVSHKHTCSMEVMEPFANDKDFGIKMADILKRMNKTLALLDVLQKDFYTGRKFLSKQKDQFENDIRRLRIQIDTHVDEIENKIRDEFNDLHNKELIAVKQRELGVQKKMDTITYWVKGVEELAKEETSLQSYVYLSKLNSNFSVIEKHASKTEKSIEYATLSLVVPDAALGVFKGLKLAHTQVKYSKTIENFEEAIINDMIEKDSPKSMDSKLTKLLQKVGEFSIEKENDFHSSLDIKALDNGDIVLVNLNNRRLEIFDQNGAPLLEMELSHNPLHTAVMENDNVAMTLASEKKIVIIDLKEKKVSKQIKVEDECHGIAFAKNKLVVNCKNVGLIFMNNDFTVEAKLPGITGKQIICGRPDGSVVGGALLSKEIYCVDMKGTKLFQCSPAGLEYLNGVSVMDSGEIYVSGYLSNTVHKIEVDGSQSCVVLNKEDEINLPSAIAYDSITRSLLILNNDGHLVVIYNYKSVT